MATQRLETAKKYVATHTDLDATTLEALISDNYQHSFSPSSITSSLPGPFDRPAYLAHQAWLRSIITGFRVNVRHMFDVPSTNQVIIWLDTVALTRPEVRDDGLEESEWDVEGECILFLDMSEDGKTIERTVEFFDSLLGGAEDVEGFDEGGGECR